MMDFLTFWERDGMKYGYFIQPQCCYYCEKEFTGKGILYEPGNITVCGDCAAIDLTIDEYLEESAIDI